VFLLTLNFGRVRVDLDSDLNNCQYAVSSQNHTPNPRRISLSTKKKNQTTSGTYRTIIDKCDVHHCRKDTVFDFAGFVQFTNFVVERLVEGSGFISTSRLMEVGFVSFLHSS
jgi:hypothetical protein